MEINVQEIFRNAFGYDLRDKPEIPEAAERTEQSSLGQPYYGEDDLGREFFMPVTIDGYLIPFAIVNINCKKTIVKTPMPERGGSVKELISFDDYAINIKGIFINDEKLFPEKQIIELHDIFKKNESIELRSVITDIFLTGNYEHRVVISDLRFPENAGVENAKPFELNCESDMIFTLEI